MEEYMIDKIEEWNKPDYEEIESNELRKIKDNLEYYENFIKELESEINFFDINEDDPLEAISNIKEYLAELKEVIR